VRICLVYDCLFPYTVGGAERWYRNLALRLVGEGHEVTYLTLRQWDRGTEPDLPGVNVVAVGPRMALYSGPGQRRIAPPLVFGAGVLAHLLRHGRRYDVVHTASFPYFSLLAAGAVRRLGGYRLVVDWHEVWTRAYWNGYLGRVGGAIGYAVQALCLRVPQQAFCEARLTAARLRTMGLRRPPTVLEGLYEGSLDRPEVHPADDTVVFAGRFIPDKRAPAVAPAVLAAAQRIPGLRGVVFGDGPDRDAVQAGVAASGGVVEAPGFVAIEVLEERLRTALCLLAPSGREGYGLVVIESAARGTPVIVVDGPDNASVELVAPGVNGVIARSAAPADLADAIVAVHEAGHALRESTADWYFANARRLSLSASLDRVAEAYRGVAAR
jgi:glycosyltransferase involved in cell wall biosynthesis